MHIPVLLTEVIETLHPQEGESVLDVTLGLGGHSRALLEKVGPSGSLTALDADSANLLLAKEHLQDWKNVQTVHANFSELPQCLPDPSQTFDIIFADIGVSSLHFDDESRGFSFRFDAPLDLRFDRTQGMTGAEFLQSTDQRTLECTFQEYGELPRCFAFIRTLVDYRSRASLQTTTDLKTIATTVYKHDAPKYLPQIFQAVRIAVNDELGALEHLLTVAPTMLKKGGRLGIISFHSLEDRLVKNAFRRMASTEKDPVTGADISPQKFDLLNKKPIRGTAEEVQKNPRARSAIFRVLFRK